MQQTFNFLSKILSFALHPIIIPTVVVAILAVFSPYLLYPIQPNFLWIFVAFIFATTWLITAVIIYALFLMGIIKQIQLDNQRERLLGICVTNVIHILVSCFLYFRLRANVEVMILFYIGIGCQFLSILITYFWKISLHSMAMWGLVCYLSALIVLKKSDELFYPLLTMILLSGFVMSARLQLQKHTIFQIAAGILLSTIVSLSVFYIFI